MHIKSNKPQRSKLNEEILDLYLSGFGQDEIYEKLKGEINEKELRTIIKENAFLSPKNFKLGTILLFLLTLLTPPISVYLRGYEYREIVFEIAFLSSIFAFPHVLLGVFFYQTKDIRRLIKLASISLAYQFIVIIIYILVSIDIGVWTISLFLIVLFPTFLGELIKLIKLHQKITVKTKEKL